MSGTPASAPRGAGRSVEELMGTGLLTGLGLVGAGLVVGSNAWLGVQLSRQSRSYVVAKALLVAATVAASLAGLFALGLLFSSLLHLALPTEDLLHVLPSLLGEASRATNGSNGTEGEGWGSVAEAVGWEAWSGSQRLFRLSLGSLAAERLYLAFKLRREIAQMAAVSTSADAPPPFCAKFRLLFRQLLLSLRFIIPSSVLVAASPSLLKLWELLTALGQEGMEPLAGPLGLANGSVGRWGWWLGLVISVLVSLLALVWLGMGSLVCKRQLAQPLMLTIGVRLKLRCTIRLTRLVLGPALFDAAFQILCPILLWSLGEWGVVGGADLARLSLLLHSAPLLAFSLGCIYRLKRENKMGPGNIPAMSLPTDSLPHSVSFVTRTTHAPPTTHGGGQSGQASQGPLPPQALGASRRRRSSVPHLPPIPGASANAPSGSLGPKSPAALPGRPSQRPSVNFEDESPSSSSALPGTSTPAGTRPPSGLTDKLSTLYENIDKVIDNPSTYQSSTPSKTSS